MAYLIIDGVIHEILNDRAEALARTGALLWQDGEGTWALNPDHLFTEFEVRLLMKAD